MTLAAEDDDTRLLFVHRVQAPDSDSGVVRGGGDDRRVSRRGSKVVDALEHAMLASNRQRLAIVLDLHLHGPLASAISWLVSMFEIKFIVKGGSYRDQRSLHHIVHLDRSIVARNTEPRGMSDRVF